MRPGFLHGLLNEGAYKSERAYNLNIKPLAKRAIAAHAC